MFSRDLKYENKLSLYGEINRKYLTVRKLHGGDNTKQASAIFSLWSLKKCEPTRKTKMA